MGLEIMLCFADHGSRLPVMLKIEIELNEMEFCDSVSGEMVNELKNEQLSSM